MKEKHRARVKLLSTDIDGTIFGDLDATQRFTRFWSALPRDRRPVLCFNSGRLVADQRSLIQSAPLPIPDYMIGGVGTEIWDTARGRFLTAFQDVFSDRWDLGRIRETLRAQSGVEEQPNAFQTAFKSSWFWRDASPEQIHALRDELESAGLRVSVVYSSRRDLDILPDRADKGLALAWLAERLLIPLGETVVAGDSGNDLRMFQLPDVSGILVQNAHPDLTEAIRPGRAFFASSREADGVVEGLKHYGIQSP